MRAPPPELTGVLFGGRYRVVRTLERGGMGSVYEARDERIGRAVAVKVMLPELASDAALLERFRREALATAALAHPNIVQVTDHGQEPGGHAFLVMELIVGRSLASLLTQSGALSVAHTVSIARQTCAALEAAHAAGIVHRDLKPGNVLVVPMGDGRELVKVVDFGVAQLKRSAAYSRLTATGAILGTPAFMPPEQARGEEVDARADVYAVGAIVYGCLAGRKPFDGADPATVIRQLLTEMPASLTALRSDVSPALASVVETAMAKDRNGRFASARALGDALAAAESGATPSTFGAAFGTAGEVATGAGLGLATRFAPPDEPQRPSREAAARRGSVSWSLVALAGLALASLAVVGTVVLLKLASARAQSTANVPVAIVSGAPPPAVVPPEPPKPGASSAPANDALPATPTPAPPTEHHRLHHAHGGAGGGNDGWVSTGTLTNTNGPQ